MPGPDPARRSRWHRLVPRDPIDGVLCVLMAIGIVLWAVASTGLDPQAPWQWLQLVVSAVLMAHASTPILFFAGALGYLNRWGRTMGRNRRWLILGFAMTVPLWLLAGQQLTVRGVGDVSPYLLGWNLVASGVMAVGVLRTLGTRRPRRRGDTA